MKQSRRLSYIAALLPLLASGLHASVLGSDTDGTLNYDPNYIYANISNTQNYYTNEWQNARMGISFTTPTAITLQDWVVPIYSWSNINLTYTLYSGGSVPTTVLESSTLSLLSGETKLRQFNFSGNTVLNPGTKYFMIGSIPASYTDRAQIDWYASSPGVPASLYYGVTYQNSGWSGWNTVTMSTGPAWQINSGNTPIVTPEPTLSLGVGAALIAIYLLRRKKLKSLFRSAAIAPLLFMPSMDAAMLGSDTVGELGYKPQGAIQNIINADYGGNTGWVNSQYGIQFTTNTTFNLQDLIVPLRTGTPVEVTFTLYSGTSSPTNVLALAQRTISSSTYQLTQFLFDGTTILSPGTNYYMIGSIPGDFVANKYVDWAISEPTVSTKTIYGQISTGYGWYGWISGNPSSGPAWQINSQANLNPVPEPALSAGVAFALIGFYLLRTRKFKALARMAALLPLLIPNVHAAMLGTDTDGTLNFNQYSTFMFITNQYNPGAVTWMNERGGFLFTTPTATYLQDLVVPLHTFSNVAVTFTLYSGTNSPTDLLDSSSQVLTSPGYDLFQFKFSGKTALNPGVNYYMISSVPLDTNTVYLDWLASDPGVPVGFYYGFEYASFGWTGWNSVGLGGGPAWQINTNPTPEPALSIGVGLALVGFYVWRNKKVKSLLRVAALLPLMLPSLHASTLGTDTDGTLDFNSNYVYAMIGNSYNYNALSWINSTMGFSFTVDTPIYLQDLVVPIRSIIDTVDLTYSLWSGTNNPGTVLESSEKQTLNFDVTFKLRQFKFSGQTLLNPGTKYFMIGTVPISYTQESQVDWAGSAPPYSLSLYYGQNWQSIGWTGWNTITASTGPAWQINTNPAPEPALTLGVGGALIALIAMRRRKRQLLKL